MSILPSTQRTIDRLKAAGFQRHEFSVRTPVTMWLHGRPSRNGWIDVDFRCSDARLLELAMPLSQQMRVRLLHLHGCVDSLKVEAAERPALLIAKQNDFQYIAVASLEGANTLASQWYAEALAREEERQASLKEWQRQRFNYQPYMEP